MTDVAVYWWSRDLRPDLPNDVVPIEKPPERTNEAYWQHMVTYIVGYGVQASRDTQETRDQINRREAISWETVNTAGNIITDHDTRCRASGDSGCGRRNDMFRASRASRGDFLAALDVASLAAQVASALESINLSEKSGTAVAAPGARLSEGDRVYVASFDPAGWTGELAAYPAIPWLNAVNTQSSLPPVVWTASIPQEPDRFILTSTARNAGSRFSWSTISAAQRDLITEEQLRWVRGDQATEVGRGGVLRPRLRLLGDIVNSTPVLSVPVDSGHGQRGSNADGRGGTAYSSFKQTANSRDAAVLVGANDGMWHVFDAKDGKELLAYVPRAMFPRLGLLADIEYRHRYYVDGQTTVGDVVRGAEWRRIAVATAGAGGRSIFAVDVTDIRSLDENDVLWDLTAEDVPSMGHILAEGVLGRAGDGNWYYFVGNGYESSIDKARLLAINVETGAVTEIGPPDGYAHDLGGPDPAGEVRNQPNGLGGITAVYGSDRTVVAVYAGDRLGQLWKFDLSKVSQVFPLGQAQGKVVAIATDGRPGATATERQSITAAPRVTRHPRGGHLVVFGTGKYFEADDRSSNQLQSIYGIWDKDPTDGIVQRGDQLAEFQLQEWVDQKSKATWRGVTPADMRASIDWRTRRGWVIDLAVNNSLTGERVLATPMLNVGFISVVSYVPTPGGDICGRGGRSFLYRLDVGTDFGRPGFADRTIGDIGVSVPATVAPMRAFVPAPAEEAQRPKATLGGAQTQALVSAPPARPPCGSIVLQDKDATAQGAPALSCGVQTLRVWRDLPRQSASSPP
jgi:type IV pilus assembly protein PilY1